MVDKIFSKGLAITTILLFLGLAIQPSIAVQPNTSDSDDDCDICPAIETISKIIDEEKYQELYDKVFRLKEVEKKINTDPPPKLCDFLEQLITIIFIPCYLLSLIGSIFIIWIFLFPFYILYSFGVVIGCFIPPPEV